MNQNLPTKELLIAIVQKGDSILMRKKPEGSPPYKERWYLFGCEPKTSQDNPTTLKNYLKSELDIDVDVSDTLISPNFEIKEDHDGIEKNFIYINLLCNYITGIPKILQGSERVEWIPVNDLPKYDLVPPSKKLLKGIGYIN